ncbi:hypothetical protein GCM10011411_26240 [Aurantiacibacter arachoides]|nr:hypothetical protein GCM10011411_26240 [Aurantiacibacter arachoides]
MFKSFERQYEAIGKAMASGKPMSRTEIAKIVSDRVAKRSTIASRLKEMAEAGKVTIDRDKNRLVYKLADAPRVAPVQTINPNGDGDLCEQLSAMVDQARAHRAQLMAEVERIDATLAPFGGA